MISAAVNRQKEGLVVLLRHDDHQTTFPLADLSVPDGTHGPGSSIVLTCGECGLSVSHPIDGGGDPDTVQRLAVLLQSGKESGTVSQRVAKARSKIKAMINGRNPGRWRSEIEDETESDMINFRERMAARAAEDTARSESEHDARIKRESDEREAIQKRQAQEQKDAEAAEEARITQRENDRKAREARLAEKQAERLNRLENKVIGR